MPPTWSDTVIIEPDGRRSLRFRFATLASPDPDDPLATSIYPVGADGTNLTRHPIVVRTRAWLGFPLPQSIGPKGEICTLPEPFWQPYQGSNDHVDD